MTENIDEVKGAFIESLTRNNKQIRSDRATAISEDAELLYKREIEDLTVQMRKIEREREGMLDLSPENAMSLKLASDFDAKEFVRKDLEIGVKIRNLLIKLEIAKERYKHLFTGGK